MCRWMWHCVRRSVELSATPHGSLGHVSRALAMGRHFDELLRMIAVKARKGEPAMRLVGVGVAQEKVRHIGGLLFGFLAEPALAGFEGFRGGEGGEAGGAG